MQIRQSDPKEELIEVTDSLIPPPPKMETAEDMPVNIDGEELSEVEKRLQQEEERYDLYKRAYKGQLSEQGESDTDSDGSTYSSFA